MTKKSKGKDCIDSLNKIPGDILTKEEKKNIHDTLNDLSKKKYSENLLNKLKEDLKTEKSELVNKRKKDRYFEALKLNDALNHIDKFNDPVKGLESFLVGTFSNVKNTGASVDAKIRSLSLKYLNEFTKAIRERNLEEAFMNPENEANLSIYLGDQKANVPADIKNIGDIYLNTLRQLTKRARANGFEISERDDYRARQVHNAKEIIKTADTMSERIAIEKDLKAKYGNNVKKIAEERHKIAFARWEEAIVDSLDLKETYGDMSFDEIKQSLRRTFDNIVGIGSKLQNGGTNIQTALNSERVFKFKNDKFLEYNKKFGSGDLHSAMVDTITREIKLIGLAESMGKNPKNFYNNLKKIMDKKYPGVLTKANMYMQDNFFRELTTPQGTVNITLGNIFNGIKTFNALMQLGRVVVSSLPDVAKLGAQLRINGSGFFDSYYNAMKALTFSNLEEANIVSESLGTLTDTLFSQYRNELVGVDGDAGTFDKAINRYFALTGIKHWDNHLRKTFGTALARELGVQIDKDFASLNERTRRTLLRYGIDSNEWELFQENKKFMRITDKDYLTPDLATHFSDESLVNYIKKTTPDAEITPELIEANRQSVEEMLRNYFVDLTELAQPKGNARTRGMVNLSSERGTWIGEIWRSIMQYKAYPISVLDGTIGRALMENGQDNLFQSLKNGNGMYRMLAEFMVMSTGLGYVSYSIGKLVSGYLPDPRSAETWEQAFLRGGSAGLLGDLLHDYKSDASTTKLLDLAGPTAGLVDDTYAYLKKMSELPFKNDSTYHQGGALLTYLYLEKHFLPNLWFFKDAYQKLFHSAIVDKLDAQYGHRMKNNLKKQHENDIKVF